MNKQWAQSLLIFIGNALLIAGLALGLSACSGTNVGNALTSEVVLGSDAGDAPAATGTSTGALAGALVGGNNLSTFASHELTLTKSLFSIRQVTLLPQSDCSVQPTLASALWPRLKVRTIFDLLTGLSDSAINLTVDNGFTTCHIRFLLGPSTADSELAGESLRLEGTTAGGRSFVIHSSGLYPLALTSQTPIEISSAKGSKLQAVFYQNTSFTGLGIDGEVGTSIDINPTDRPVLFALVMRKLRRSLRAYRFSRDANNQIVQDHTSSLAEGNENLSDLEDDEK